MDSLTELCLYLTLVAILKQNLELLFSSSINEDNYAAFCLLFFLQRVILDHFPDTVQVGSL